MILFIFLPFMNVLISGLLSRYIGTKNTKIMNIINLIILLLLLIYYYINIISNKDINYIINIMELINIEYLNINYSIKLDLLSISMLIPIIIISLIVNIFSIDYMHNDNHNNRFYTYLSIFTLFMIILVLGDNYLILFIGWEYIGIASFLLIGFWYNNIDNIKSSLNALFINKIGDIFFIIALIYIIYIYKSLNYSLIFSLVSYINIDINNIIILCLVIAASAKSAQLGLHNWLIWAMAGPTPVSVLLHAATLVIAGVYLLLRSSPILENCPNILLFILWLGGLTSLISGLIAINTNDIKKIIALSTMSQLGIMFISIGLSCYNLTLFHIICHSFYKALLFISSGIIIHSLINELQDIRFIGGLLTYLPITYICILIGSLSLMGLPSLSGYYSKDIIIESSLGIYTISGLIIYWLIILSSFLTNIYILKLIYYSFINIPQLNKYTLNNINEFNSILSLFCLIILTLFSLFIGYLFNDIYLGQGNNLSGLFINPNNLIFIDTHFSLAFINYNNIYYGYLLKILPLINIFISIFVLYIIYYYNYLYIYNNNLFINIYKLFNSRFLFDQVFNNILINYIYKLANILYYLIDKGILIFIGPVGLNILLINLSLFFGSPSTSGRNPSIINDSLNKNNYFINFGLLFNHYLIYIITSLLLLLYLINF